MNTIKEIVESTLKERRITAKKMCEDLGMPEQTLYQIFRKNSGRSETLEKIGNYLGIKLNVVVSFGEVQDNSSLQKLIDYLKKENEFLRSYINEKLMVDLGKFDVISLPRVLSLYFFGFTNTTDNILS